MPTLITQIRQKMLKQRRQLTQKQRYQAAFLASLHLHKLHSLLPKHAKIGLYLDAFGEIPTTPLFHFCQQYQHFPYLPITRPDQALRFAPIHPNLQKNPFKQHHLGMKEPTSPLKLIANQMDAIVCPLVAVDTQGIRMGMGGGYYDRTFVQAPNTLKVAWCYDWQLLKNLPKQPWDQAVDLIITDQKIVRLR